MFHICFFAVAFAFFIYNHKQPNEYGVNMHWVATAWILIGGFLRLRGSTLGDTDSSSGVKESGCAYIMAAYTFTGGQLGLTLWAARNSANPGSFVLAWHAIPIIVIIAYARTFCFGASPSDYQHTNNITRTNSNHTRGAMFLNDGADNSELASFERSPFLGDDSSTVVAKRGV